MAEIPSEPRAFAVFDGDLDQDWFDRYAGAQALAVDTEAMGLIHGRDRLCLVQICDDNCCLLRVKDFDPAPDQNKRATRSPPPPFFQFLAGELVF